MFSTSTIIDNLEREELLDYKKLCRILKLSKKADKNRLSIALGALEKLEIITINDENEYSRAKESKHIVARIRCSSKGYCFAVRENNKEDIYIRENLLNHAWNGDKVLVRIIKEGYRRRSPEGIVDCILERSNQILLAKVEIINNQVYAIPIDDRILSKIKLPEGDEKYQYKVETKNIVKVEIDLFPIGQHEGMGHVIKELNLSKNEKLDTEFVLSKSNLIGKTKVHEFKPLEIKKEKRIDLSDKDSYMFKSWLADNSPILPVFQIENNKDKTTNLWIHTNAISERLDLNSKKNLDIFSNNFESYPLLNGWKNYLGENIINATNFLLGEKKEAISLCITLDSDKKIVNWSFHLTLVKCSFIVENKHLEALLNRKSKTRITSSVLKPIKEYINDLDKILEISLCFRSKQLARGNFELTRPVNNIESLNEIFIQNPSDYLNNYLDPLDCNDCQSYISPIVYEADSIWFKHAKEYKLNLATYPSFDNNYTNISEIIKYSDLLDSDLELNQDGNLTIKQLVEFCKDDKKKILLHKLLINMSTEKELLLFTKDSEIKEEKISYISPWTMPSYDFTNLINQNNIYNMIINGKRTSKNNKNKINITEKNSWKEVNWDIYNSSTLKNIEFYLNTYTIDKINEFKNKTKQYRANMIGLKQARKVEKLVGNIYSGFITTVQSYGFFVLLDELNVEGLVHVSTLNNDWFEYRSRQNLLIGRKSKRSYKIGDKVNIKIIKVDILKYQIDLELS